MSTSDNNLRERSTQFSSLEPSDISLSRISLESFQSTPWGSQQTPNSYSGRQNGVFSTLSATSSNGKSLPSYQTGSNILLTDGLSRQQLPVDDGLSEEQKEFIRLKNVGRKKDYKYMERVNGKLTNVVQGLELHTQVFNSEEQKKIVEYVYNLQKMGQKGQLRARTYSEPRKWMRGKGRVTIQFGCCYNYAVDKEGNPPGILRDEEVDPLPPLFIKMIRRMIRWHVLPPTCIPNSCIVNIYDEGDCIPPHIDHHDFVRPFCTVSFLTECNILFGSNLKVAGPGEFSGPFSIPLPVGSVLVLKGNGADIAKHCVPAVPSKRISVTFRKMDDNKIPYGFQPHKELLDIKPLFNLTKSPVQQIPKVGTSVSYPKPKDCAKTTDSEFILGGEDEFPSLGSLRQKNYRSTTRSRP